MEHDVFDVVKRELSDIALDTARRAAMEHDVFDVVKPP